MSNPTCIVMVGLPATGKSTIVNRVVRDMSDHDTRVFVYSTDGILERIADFLGKTYNDVFEKHIKSATAEADIDLAHAIKERQDIIWDQTNLSAKKRAKIINRMRQAGYRVECGCILLPAGDSQWEDWRHRMQSRPGKTIPDSVIESMMDSFVMPTVDEGFDAVRCYDMYGNSMSG